MSGTGRAAYSPGDHLASYVFWGPLCVWIGTGAGVGAEKEVRGGDLERSFKPLRARVRGATVSQKMKLESCPLGQPLLQSEASVGLFVGWAAATGWWGAQGRGMLSRASLPCYAAHLS